MEILTPEEIAKQCAGADGITNIKMINALYRKQDESHLWPISGRFNVTERAIRKARAYQRDAGFVYGYEYSMLLDQIISEIVNTGY